MHEILSGVDLWAGLLLVMNRMNCPLDTAPDNTILRPIAFARKNPSITYHKPLLSTFKKDVATLSQRLQCILLRIHQKIHIMYT